MLKRFLPRETGFFELFGKQTQVLVKAATQYHAMLQDLANVQMHVDIIKQEEHEADKIANTAFKLLHKTFITPFDRHDIHQLISRIDDIVDLINRCAQRFPIYQLQSSTIETLKLAELGIRCGEKLCEAVKLLEGDNNRTTIFKICEQIHRLESEAHQIVLAGEYNLFTEQNDFKEFIKRKEIYSLNKSVINACEDVGNLLKGIVMEYT